MLKLAVLFNPKHRMRTRARTSRPATMMPIQVHFEARCPPFVRRLSMSFSDLDYVRHILNEALPKGGIARASARSSKVRVAHSSRVLATVSRRRELSCCLSTPGLKQRVKESLFRHDAETSARRVRYPDDIASTMFQTVQEIAPKARPSP
jgi:hypothetical protein